MNVLGSLCASLVLAALGLWLGGEPQGRFQPWCGLIAVLAAFRQAGDLEGAQGWRTTAHRNADTCAA
ncbi:hypothetical protein AB0I85_07050 [Micromonospora echinofusca]|uniref:hypothetical protein n=1 Tax=Micromonospora echinofusca TaxID=47858 RepID=UPI001183EEB5